jgi:hypothetical protein
MSPKAWFFVAVSLSAVIAVSSSLAREAATPLKVTSSIDHKTVLPQRLHWLAYTKVPAAQVAEVDFLIDGKLRWIEHFAPYNYASDDFHGHLGYLFTSWLAPRKHRFTARVVTKDGQTGTDTVVARVLAAAEPPAKLAGVWTRKVTAEDLKKVDPKFGSGPPAGTWRLVFDRAGAWHLDPLGSGIGNGYGVTGNIIRVYAPIQMAPLINGHTTTRRYGHTNIGGVDCREDGPPGSYTWAASGGQLTLHAIREGCGQRRAIWEGTWRRIP